MHPGIRRRIDTPLGAMTLWVTPEGLAGAWFHDQAHAPVWASLGPEGTHPWLDLAETWLAAYFNGRLGSHQLPPLDLSRGTPFQQAVWRALQAIPEGRTSTYSAVAERLGRPQSARAVGAAIGRNPLSVVIPCHRVLGAKGAMTGYAGGLWRKEALLSLESGQGSD
ncbi:MAG: hypothetical protein RL357_73 [Pseudomonadota bacterium]